MTTNSDLGRIPIAVVVEVSANIRGYNVRSSWLFDDNDGWIIDGAFRNMID